MNIPDYISASEVGDYVYCKRGWWLRRHGLLSTTGIMIQGSAQHESLFLKLLRFRLIRNVLLGVIFILLLLVIGIFIFTS